MLETGVAEATEEPDPAPPRGRGVRRPTRHGDRACPAVRPHPGTRRPAGGALRHRHQGGSRARGRVGPVRPRPPAARHHRGPGSPPGSGGDRAGGRRHPRRRHRVHGAAAAAQLRPGLAALPARPHRGQDRRRSGPGAPRERHHRPLRRGRAVRRAGALLRPIGAAGPTRRCAGGRHGADRCRGPDGVDRMGRRDGPKRPGAVLAADQTLAQRAGATTPIASVVPRQRIRVAGRVKSVRVQPRAGTSNLECVLSDGTGGSAPRLPGQAQDRRHRARSRLVAEGMVGTWGRRPAMLNPTFELVQGAPSDPAEP